MDNGKLTLGLVGSSTKENEHRVAIHPKHFPLFDEETKKKFMSKRVLERTLPSTIKRLSPTVPA